ncbi:MAG: DUF3311 domain-containing protein [Actinomycetes bacterium]
MSHPNPEPPRAESIETATRRHVNRSPWNLLLIVPLVICLSPWIYNRNDPELAGVPFFYWFQLASIGVGVLCTLIVYRATRGER